MDNSFISFLATLTPKDILVNHLEEALRSYKIMPVDGNFQRLAMFAALLAIIKAADGDELRGLLQQMVSDTIPYLNSSAN